MQNHFVFSLQIRMCTIPIKIGFGANLNPHILLDLVNTYFEQVIILNSIHTLTLQIHVTNEYITNYSFIENYLLQHS